MTVPNPCLHQVAFVERFRQLGAFCSPIVPPFFFCFYPFARFPGLAMVFAIGGVDGEIAVVGFQAPERIAVTINKTAVGIMHLAFKMGFENPMVVVVQLRVATTMLDDGAIL